MGAAWFETIASGKDAATAFKAAVDEARYLSGHGGYTGTIAEKRAYKLVAPKPGETWYQTVRRYEESDGHEFDDKWGPAGCIKIEEGMYVFFGWASE